MTNAALRDVTEKGQGGAPRPPPWNTPLRFRALRSLDPDHDYLTRVLRFKRSTMERFGVGFCSKGMMRGRIAIPIHDETGQLMAYCGRKPGARGVSSDRYPDEFWKGYEVYNVHVARETVGPRMEGLIVTGDFTDVWRLYEFGWTNVVALLEPEVSVEQLRIIDHTAGADRRVSLLFDWDSPGFVDVLFALQGAFYLRLCRPPRGKRIVELDFGEARKALASGA